MSAWDWMTGATGGNVGRWRAPKYGWSGKPRAKPLNTDKMTARRRKALRLKSVDELLEEQSRATRRD